MSKEREDASREIEKRSFYITSTLNKISKHSLIPSLVARKADDDYVFEIRRLSKRKDHRKGWKVICSRGKIISGGAIDIKERISWTFSNDFKGSEEGLDPETVSYVINSLSEIALSVYLLKVMSEPAK